VTASDVLVTLTDLQAVAITIDAEGRGDTREGGSSVEERIAIGCAIRNRLKRPRRFGGATFKAICLAPSQFSCWQPVDGEVNHLRTMALARAVVAAGPLPFAGLEADLFLESLFLAEGLIGGQLLDRIAGADHYMTSSLYARFPAVAQAFSNPKHWVYDQRTGGKRTPVIAVGSSVFFVGVP
jgi:hypothetical protein